MTQNESILQYLKAGNTITPLEALYLFGTLRLGARVHDLKADGHDIIGNLVTRDGKTFSEYHIRTLKHETKAKD